MAKIYGDRWEIDDSLAEGGQGHTFIVTDIKDPYRSKAVLKRYKNPKRSGRFRDEIKALSKLEHRNILEIRDSDLNGDVLYYVAEYCTGGSLREHFQRGRQPLKEVFRIFLGIAEGLQHAHAAKIVHRDLKPDNVFIRLPDVDPVIGDFGLCFLNESDDRLTVTDEAVGPRNFMAPELEDGRVDTVLASADIYSLGKLFYWMLTGGKMFSREKQREAAWDLKKNVPNPHGKDENFQMEHITRLFDYMIVADPKQRGTLEDIIFSARRIQSLERFNKSCSHRRQTNRGRLGVLPWPGLGRLR